jgi:dihydrolipoamide dehydrogenase
MNKTFDIIVVGAGVSGCEVALILAKNKKNVCLIEKQYVGGTCLNEGCIPAKNFLQSAEFFKKSSHYTESICKFDLNRLKQNTTKLIEDQRVGLINKLKNSKVDIYFESVESIVGDSVKLKDRNYTLKAKHIILASGSIHKEHPELKVNKKEIISSKEVFELEQIPESILIVGGGAIGCEFASFFNSFDCKVDIVEFANNLISQEDEDISKALKREFEKSNINIYLNSHISEHKIINNQVETIIKTKNADIAKRYDKILISIGREPNSSYLDRDIYKLDNKFVQTNDDLSLINHSHIYAIGDIIKTPALAHIGQYEARVVACNILTNQKLKATRYFPSVVFSFPQVGSIGNSDKYLKNNNIDFKVKKYFFKSSSKARIKNDNSGFIKILYDPSSYQLLGASIIGVDATELIHQLLIALDNNITIKDLSKTIFAHPTLSESIFDTIASI